MRKEYDVRKIKLSPSVFAADLGELKNQIKELEESNVELLHVDVMDGHFVERMAFGADHIRALKSMTDIPLDVHLMIECPEVHIDSIAEAGADIITIHQESTARVLSCLHKIRNRGIRAGIVLSPVSYTHLYWRQSTTRCSLYINIRSVN